VIGRQWSGERLASLISSISARALIDILRQFRAAAAGIAAIAYRAYVAGAQSPLRRLPSPYEADLI